MMDFISQHFIDCRIIEGGVQLNLSIASLVIILWFATWRVKRLLVRKT